MSGRRLIPWVLGAVVLIGTVSGTLLTFRLTPTDPDSILAHAGEPGAPRSHLDVAAVLRDVDPGTGVLSADLSLRPSPDLIDRGILEEDLTVYVDDISKAPITTFRKGSDVGTLSVTLPLRGSTILRYPLDSYKATLRMAARVGAAPGTAELPIVMNVSSNLDGFNASAEDQEVSDRHVIVDLALDRSGTVILWTVLVMIVWWAIALGCAGVALWWCDRPIEVPPWPWTLLVASLFAIPSLRNNLPGSPVYGSLVDWASFYWAVVIVGASLIALLLAWNRAVRRTEGRASPDR